jgi:broad specificity phosphatase PhoE
VVTILLVRHAEKNAAMVGHDVPLSATGERRAHALARLAGEAGVSAIYVTPTVRARDTAAPLAARLGGSLTVVNDVGETVARLRTSHWGSTALVVGHSDTVPQIIEGLTGRRIPGFSGEFDVLYVVTLARDGRSSIVRLRYGE